MASVVNSTKQLRNKYNQIYTNSHEIEEKGIVPNSFCQACIIITPKSKILKEGKKPTDQYLS